MSDQSLGIDVFSSLQQVLHTVTVSTAATLPQVFECPSLPRLVHQVSRQFALVVTHLTQFFEVSVMFQQCSDDCTLVMISSMVQGSESLSVSLVKTSPEVQEPEDCIRMALFGGQVHGGEVIVTLGLELSLFDLVLGDEEGEHFGVVILGGEVDGEELLVGGEVEVGLVGEEGLDER